MKNVSKWTGARGIALIASLALVVSLTGGSLLNKVVATASPECSPNSPQTIVSDETTQVDSHGAVAVTPHPEWTASIPGATWVYSEALDGNGSSPIGSKTFTKTFTISGDPVNSSLNIATDNYYSVSVNGNAIDTGSSATDLDNFHSADTWVIPAAVLVSGPNTITITVTNPGTDPVSGNPFGDPNPAGLLYKLTVNSQTCVSPDVTVTIVKYMDGVRATSENANNTAFNMTSSWDAENLGPPGSGSFDLDADGFNGDPTPYQAITSPMTSGADYSVVENNIPESCDGDEGYSLEGYRLGDSESLALANSSVPNASLTDITSNKFILVMNHDCSIPPPPPVIPPCVPDSPILTTFDTFSLGSVNGQNGWSATNPAYDQEVVTNTYGYSTFGCQSLRVSDAVASGSFGDWIFSNSLANEAGETGAINSGYSGGVRQNHFEAQFDIASTLPNAEQPDLHVSVSPDRGDGARMSYLRFVDQSDGIHVYFDDYSNGDFNETDIATLDRTLPHTVKFVMDFVDGPGNDIVKIYIDGNLEITGTSWEDYFRDNQSDIAPPTVDSIIIQARGNSTPANAGNGFLFDNVSLTSSTNPLPPPFVKVHIFKYLDNGETTVQVQDDSTLAPFPMHASWDAVNLGPPAEGDYVLGNNHGGAALRYSADTSPMQTPVASYNTYERTTDVYPQSQVLPIDAECSTDMFRLLGYKSGNSLEEAQSATLTDTAPTYTAFSNDKYLIVVNEDCNNVEDDDSTHIIVRKVTNLEEDSTEFNFTTTGDDYEQSFVLSDDESNDQEVAPGTYTITEGPDFPGWALGNVTCFYDGEAAGQPVSHGHQVEVDEGDTVICTFYNSYLTGVQGHLIVRKVLVNAPETSPSDFNFVLNNQDALHAFDQDGENTITLAPGTYSITEPFAEGYTTTYENCSNLDIQNGETETCTITNTVPTPPVENSGGGGGGGAAPLTGISGGGGGGTQGQVLGTSTGPTIDTNPGVLPTCSTSYLTEYMRFGRRNSPDQVSKLQTFLNEFQNAGLPVSGFFGRLTLAAVKTFQVSQEQYIRPPWANAGSAIVDAKWPTGYVYKTTLWRINAIKCASLNAPVPQLP